MPIEKKYRHFVQNIFFIALIVFFYSWSPAGSFGKNNNVQIITVDSGWANNSINTAVFRKNSLVSFGDYQYISFYNKNGYVVLGKRKLNEQKWELKQTSCKGNVLDAHNVISIMIDGAGFLHVAWDHHNNKLHYAKNISPGSLELSSQLSMTGRNENKVSYPEFYRMPNGNLLFFYRDGGSGNGNLVINQYNLKTNQWATLQSNLIDGEGKRNAYWQACIDDHGTIHISWVWRETPDVSSNHDICYARSKDDGITWEKSTGEKYQLPINSSNAEIACVIPQQSELINQASMVADEKGNPYIATYWREKGSSIPQYHLVFKNKDWQIQNLKFRKTAFSLSGSGTKQIPISRPQIISWNNKNKLAAAIIFRDAERGNKVSVAISQNLKEEKWVLQDLDNKDVGSWEPTYDTELWKIKKLLHLFVQKTEQADAEGLTNTIPQMVEVLEWKPWD